MSLLGIAVIGLAVGFLGGLLGKGGSAIATPLLHAIGIPAVIAVASPLPATIPGTLTASWVYWREQLIDWRAVRWSLAVGAPATVVGAIATRWIDGDVLVGVTDVVLIALGVKLVLTRPRSRRADGPEPAAPTDQVSAGTLIGVAVVVGLSAGLLANSGGFLLAPLLITVAELPIRRALASSLAISAVLAVPGTLVHAVLGHIDWQLVLVFALTSVPLSLAGARCALRIDARRLERGYGVMLVVLGSVFLVLR